MAGTCRIILGLTALILAAGLCGCAQRGGTNLQVVRFEAPAAPAGDDQPIVLHAARNEVVSFVLKVPDARGLQSLRIATLRHTNATAEISTENLRAYQVLPMPIDTNRAGFVRHTGQSVDTNRLPRALLPLAMWRGTIDASALRRPADQVEGITLWIDVQIPATAAAGDYRGSCRLSGASPGELDLHLSVDEFVIPDQRHLLLVGRAPWDDLLRLYPKAFGPYPPKFLSRQDKNCAPAIATLDQLQQLAHAHRVELVFPQLQPVVKWPSGAGPQIDWTDFDSLVLPWLKGEVFADRLPAGYWPIPWVENLHLHETSSRLGYFKSAAEHFQELEYLDRSAVELTSGRPGHPGLMQSVELSEQIGLLLRLNPNLRVRASLDEEHVQLSTPQNPRRVPEDAIDRLMYMAAGLVSTPPIQRLPESAGRWLATDQPALVPSAGSGIAERDARLWAWLAFLRDAGSIHWDCVLPRQAQPDETASADEMIWFYPGEWFGLDWPVPTVQLKWMRRAQQDYEYLYLARQRGQHARALMLARLMVRPVELQPSQLPDQAYALLSGTSEPQVWAECMRLLSRTIAISQPGQDIDSAAERQLALDLTAWSADRERPMLLGNATNWWIDRINGEPQIHLQLGLDIYSAADHHPQSSRLVWGELFEPWQSASPRGAEVPHLPRYAVSRAAINARMSAAQLRREQRPVGANFIDGYTNRVFPLQVVAPAGRCERREGPPPRLDGSLDDWSSEDAIHQGNLIRMLDRPTVQNQYLSLATTSSAVYATQTATNLYIGFKLDGADAPVTNAERSFIDYDLRRAWGEDVCELLIQPIYADNSTGPVLHVAVKPRGQLEVSRRLNPKLNADPWQAFSSSDIRYACNTQEAVWRGELAMPWDAIGQNAAGQMPVMLRFNFAQHRGRTGESATWAGPVDFGRTDRFTGLLYLTSRTLNGP